MKSMRTILAVVAATLLVANVASANMVEVGLQQVTVTNVGTGVAASVVSLGTYTSGGITYNVYDIKGTTTGSWTNSKIVLPLATGTFFLDPDNFDTEGVNDTIVFTGKASTKTPDFLNTCWLTGPKGYPNVSNTTSALAMSGVTPDCTEGTSATLFRGGTYKSGYTFTAGTYTFFRFAVTADATSVVNPIGQAMASYGQLIDSQNPGGVFSIAITQTPEPITMALLAIGGLGILARRRS